MTYGKNIASAIITPSFRTEAVNTFGILQGFRLSIYFINEEPDHNYG